MTIEPEKIGGAARRFAPDIVIGHNFEEAELECVPALVELSLDPTHATKVKVKEDRSEITNPTLDKLLDIIEEVAQLQ